VQPEADESQYLIFVPLDCVKRWTFEPELAKDLTPHAKGGLRLLHLLLAKQE